jgi:hypothetical protein
MSFFIIKKLVCELDSEITNSYAFNFNNREPCNLYMRRIHARGPARPRAWNPGGGEPFDAIDIIERYYPPPWALAPISALAPITGWGSLG